jgi:hypothetical protein
MTENKTQKTGKSAEAFLNTVKDAQQRSDAFVILEMMRKATKSEPAMWGGAIIGFGKNSYRTADGKDHDWFMIGFSPRAKKFSLYLMGEKGDGFQALLKKMGKYKMSTGCLYVNKLSDVDTKVLQELFERQVKICLGK